jgi:hypothetical protein
VANSSADLIHTGDLEPQRLVCGVAKIQGVRTSTKIVQLELLPCPLLSKRVANSLLLHQVVVLVLDFFLLDTEIFSVPINLFVQPKVLASGGHISVTGR